MVMMITRVVLVMVRVTMMVMVKIIVIVMVITMITVTIIIGVVGQWNYSTRIYTESLVFSNCQKVWQIWSRNIFTDRKKSRPFKRVMMPFGETEIQEANSWTEEIYLFYEEISLFWRSKSQKNWITRRKSNICHIPGSRIFRYVFIFWKCNCKSFYEQSSFQYVKSDL